ncbi:transcriptional regulator [Vagococcus penaei]|uniref:Transcriptional regulator n=1 Tax=Vagococcus penaei TaxID=633807 RepID=A0A1Q2D880_9ENTE|nr:helix-turn-helix domain-containing protein [Vagococcus penaei]AQP54505.1 transcriptional regulator [Vagococcus penaei]RSU06786.1 transcriptional regulator [Vagococcus penaei]
METIIQIMKKYNFSEMETLVYITLLERGALTGYEVSKQSGVARSKVYNILEKLLKKDLVIVNKSEPKLYCALPAEEFISRLEEETTRDLQLLDRQLGNIKEYEEDEMLWKLEGYDNLLKKVGFLIGQTQSSLLMQIWVEDLSPELVKALLTVEQRVSQFVLIVFSRDKVYDLPFKKYYRHGFEDEKLQDFGTRWINLVVDEVEVIFGTIDDTNSSIDVTLTRNQAMVSLSKEYIKHDAYTLKIIADLPKELQQKYGEHFEKVRSIYWEE